MSCSSVPGTPTGSLCTIGGGIGTGFGTGPQGLPGMADKMAQAIDDGGIWRVPAGPNSNLLANLREEMLALKNILDNAKQAVGKFGAAAVQEAFHATAQLAKFIQKNGFNITAKILIEMEESQAGPPPEPGVPVDPPDPEDPPESAPAHWQEYPGYPSAAQLSAVSGIAAQLGPQGVQALAAILPYAGQLASAWKQDGLFVNSVA